MLISLIAAMTPDRIIGFKGQLPWKAPEDLKYFKALTAGHSVLMGRKTFDSIRKPLPNRANLILSRAIPEHPPAGTRWFVNLSHAVAAAQESGESELFVAGGAEIYALAMPLADRMYISMIQLDKPAVGDTWFPFWRPEEWRLESRRPSTGVEFMIYNRIRARA